MAFYPMWVNWPWQKDIPKLLKLYLLNLKTQPCKIKQLKVSVLPLSYWWHCCLTLYPTNMYTKINVHRLNVNTRTSDNAACLSRNYKTHGSPWPEMTSAVEGRGFLPCFLTQKNRIDIDPGNGCGKKNMSTLYLKKQSKQQFNYGNFLVRDCRKHLLFEFS